MSDNFKALVVNQEGDKFSREVKSVNKDFLKHGDVLVKVEYSGLNYKDALILKNGAKLVKEFPHIPGIDFSGTVVESKNENFLIGNKKKFLLAKIDINESVMKIVTIISKILLEKYLNLKEINCILVIAVFLLKRS